MNRRDFLISSFAMGAQGARRAPNFVVILADDLGYGDLGCFGSRDNQTPNLDRMASEGARLTDCYAPTPYCAPSRATLLTGRYPFRHGMVSNPAPDAGLDSALSPKEVTLPQALKPKGYASACIGKWHLGHTADALPRKRGFDSYYGIPYSNDMRPVQIVRNEEVVQYPVVQGHLTRDYTREALGFIDRNRRNPFLLYLAHAMPHKPVAASEEFYSRKPGRLYADAVRELDWSVGEVLKRLAGHGLDEDTLVFFLSDNGPWYGGSTGGLRGMKARMWEGGIRVPMIARWPGRIPRGVVNRGICGVMDVFPTVVEAAGVRVPQDRTIDGRSILPMCSSADAPSPHEAICAMTGQNLQIIRSGRWKLHVRSPGATGSLDNAGPGWVDSRGPDGLTLIAPWEQARPPQHPGRQDGDAAKPMMLFDLENDPAEQHDVAAQNPEVVKRLKAMFDGVNAQVPSFAPVEPRWKGIRDIKGGDLKYEPRNPVGQ